MGTSLSTSQHTMSVELNPPELGFKRPFNEERAVSLQLTNSTAESVAFKVKTTAPKQYYVRPNSGIIRPHDHVEVQVLLQAMKEEPPLDYKCRDKFLVQSVALDSSHNPDDGLTTLWSAIEKTSKSSIQEKKIRVNFLAPGAPTPNGVSSEMEEKPPSYTATSPSPQFDSPAPQKSTVGDSARSAAEATGVAGAAAAVSSAIPTSQEELKSQLAAAQAHSRHEGSRCTTAQGCSSPRKGPDRGSTKSEWRCAVAYCGCLVPLQLLGGVVVLLVEVVCLCTNTIDT